MSSIDVIYFSPEMFAEVVTTGMFNSSTSLENKWSGILTPKVFKPRFTFSATHLALSSTTRVYGPGRISSSLPLNFAISENPFL